MAADTRPYKSKEQDGQGNEVIIRDQQLVEQSTVTTMPSGACFETLDIDGRPVKIPRDNMMSIVLECIGIVLNDSSKNLGTNVNKALGLQGNTIGNVTVNDFASVLGVANNIYNHSIGYSNHTHEEGVKLVLSQFLEKDNFVVQGRYVLGLSGYYVLHSYNTMPSQMQNGMCRYGSGLFIDTTGITYFKIEEFVYSETKIV